MNKLIEPVKIKGLAIRHNRMLRDEQTMKRSLK